MTAARKLPPRDPNSDPGPKPALAWLPIGKLSVDPKYQRDTGSRRSQSLIAKIAADFRWSRFGIVLCVKVGRAWHVIDGQHRVMAALARGGIAEVPAVVLPHATIEAAAADFVAINRDRVSVTPLHIHHAQLAAGDPAALAVARVCQQAGVTICRYPVPADKMVPGQTLAVQTIARVIRLRDEAFATAVLKRVMATTGKVAGGCNALIIRQAVADLGLREKNPPSIKGRAASATMRKCLRCQRPFASTGPGNRMCIPCGGVSE